MPSWLKKMKDLDAKTYEFESFIKVPKGKRPGQVSLIYAHREIAKILMCFSNTILNTAHYGYAFIVYTNAQWTALGNANQVVYPVNASAYVGQDQAAQYLNEAQKATYVAYKKHSDATVQMILYIFGEDVFSLNIDKIVNRAQTKASV